MDPTLLRRIATIVYGIIVALLWIFAAGPVALTVTIVGAILLGLLYVVTGRQISDRGLGRQRQRNRNRP